MNKRITFFDNYDISGYEEMAKEYLSEDGSYEPSDSEINYAVQDYIQTDWDYLSTMMDNVFDGQPIIISGLVGRWDGKRTGGDIYKSWDEFIAKFGKDCEYFEVYSELGHLYVRCSHHDGTNFCEVKKMTKRGERYYDNWEYGVDPRTDNKPETYIRNRIFTCSAYSQLPKISW